VDAPNFFFTALLWNDQRKTPLSNIINIENNGVESHIAAWWMFENKNKCDNGDFCIAVYK